MKNLMQLMKKKMHVVPYTISYTNIFRQLGDTILGRPLLIPTQPSF